MNKIRETIIKKFGNKLRVRVCGLCIEDDKILLVNHHSLNDEGEFWVPPGGGMDFGLSAEENLKREFQEETGLNIEIEKFLFVHEYLSPPLQAIELIFKVRKIGGNLYTGFDPEMGSKEQIIENVQFIEFKKIRKMNKDALHQMFSNVNDIQKIENLDGYFLWKK